jgi:two-component system OmpR family response regulator
MSEVHELSFLLIEDDNAVATELMTAFAREGWTVVHKSDGAEGLRVAAQKPYAAIVLDRKLPSLDGMAILEKLRAMQVGTPVLILSAIAEPPERVKGLERGADDYLAKPFTLEEVIARVRALIRRARAAPHPEVLVEGALEMWTKAERALYAGVQLGLSDKEFKLLRLLVEHSGSAVTRRMILERVFNWRAASDPGTNLVEVHIHRLRKKIEEVAGRPLISTVRGDGYMYEQPRAEPA